VILYRETDFHDEVEIDRGTGVDGMTPSARTRSLAASAA
jgi:hypothetical protein